MPFSRMDDEIDVGGGNVSLRLKLNWRRCGGGGVEQNDEN